VEADSRHASSFDVSVMSGVGHFPQLERPEEFNELLAAAIADMME
jgi:pimeloyl-ACP methyl ester carboxylesterase